MLNALIFLVSLIIMSSVAATTKTYLRKNNVSEPGSDEYKRLFELLSKAEYMKKIAEKKPDAKLCILEGNIMPQLDNILSNHSTYLLCKDRMIMLLLYTSF